jgi:hypothetical protein
VGFNLSSARGSIGLVMTLATITNIYVGKRNIGKSGGIAEELEGDVGRGYERDFLL